MPSTWTPPTHYKPIPPSRMLFKRIFGEDLSSDAAFERIEEGISTQALDAFADTFNATSGMIANILKISGRTLARRRAEGRLSSVESDRFYRLLALYAKAADVLDGIDAADEWMRSPAVALGDKTPLDYTVNEAGAQRVEQILTRIEHGVYS